MFNIKEPPFNAKGDITTDDTQAILDCLDAAQAAAVSRPGQTVLVPEGTYRVMAGFTVTQPGVHILGESNIGSKIRLAAEHDDTLIKFDYSYDNGSVRSLGLEYSKSAPYSNTGLHVVDATRFVIDTVDINGFRFGNSTGLRLSGREAITINKLFSRAVIPVRISENPNVSGSQENSADHMVFRDSYFNAWAPDNDTTLDSACVLVDDGARFTNLTFEGSQAWVGAANGFHWGGTTSFGGARPSMLNFRNVRYEQSSGGGWMFYVTSQAAAALKNLNISGCAHAENAALSAQGLYARNVENILINGAYFNQTAAGHVVDIDECEAMVWNAVETNTQSTASINGLTLEQGHTKTGYNLPHTAVWNS